MAYLVLHSENKDFSFLIKKNPHNEKLPLLIKKVRQGIMVGTYKPDDIQSYGVWFKEGKNKNSYGNKNQGNFSYQNPQQYNSPLFVLNAIGQYLAAPMKKFMEKDTKARQTMILGIVRCGSGGEKILKMMGEYFSDKYTLEYKEISPKNMKIIVKGNVTLFEFLNFVNVLALMLVIRDNHSYRETEGLEKYISSLKVIDAPYFVKYIFKTNWLRKYDDFNKYKKLLEEDELQLEYGNTSVMRRDCVKNLLDYSRDIVDLGCGEGFYMGELAPKLDKVYYGIDIDPEELRKAQNKINFRKLENINLLSSWNNFVDNYKGESFDLLFIEVMEHMPLEKAKEIIKQVQCHEKINSLIITTPNKDFNKFYNFDESEMRHHDHDFELSKKEFLDLMEELVDKTKFSYEFFEMGDKVEGLQTSQGVKLERRP